MNTALADDAIKATPCRIRRAGTPRRARTPKPATLAELAVIVDDMPEEYRAAVLIAAWTGLRFRLGHSTPVAAMRYQHATDDRDRAIAEALSEFHAGNVVALRPRQGRTA